MYPGLVRRRLARVAFFFLLTALLTLLLHHALVERHRAGRGVGGDGPPPLPGVTVELAQYDPADLERALDGAERLGLRWLRQKIAWDQVEPAPGRYRWARYDQALAQARARGFDLLLVLDRTPAWARHPDESDNPLAPPADPALLARFATAAAARYREHGPDWQIWDEPNLAPHAGTEVLIDPAAYTRLVAQVAPAIRAADPDARVISGGLGATTEVGGFNMSEILFAAGLAERGALDHLDAIALKAYGFWRGPADRIYDPMLPSLDRVVLVREALDARGAGSTGIWIVEGGWATLPAAWSGDAPPWGADRPLIQQQRLEVALQRVAVEWDWVERVGFQLLQPAATPSDPRLGLALLTPAGTLTPLGETVQVGTRQWYADGSGSALSAARAALRAQRQRQTGWVALLLLAVTASGGALLWHGARLPWAAWGHRFCALPLSAQMGALLGVALLFYAVDNRVAALLLYALLGLLTAWRLDLALVLVAGFIPFFLQGKTIAPLTFSMVELLLLPCTLVWLGGRLRAARGPRAFLRSVLQPRDGLDWIWLALALWAAISLFLAPNFGVAAREFRVVVAESILWYWLIRRVPMSASARHRIAGGLIAGATLMAGIALYQWLLTDQIIQAEGVRRALGLYGSPNNLALMLERVLPLALAVALLAPGRMRWWGGAAAMGLAAALLLTFSRGALLLGMPAAMLVLMIGLDRRARLWLLGAGLVGLLLLLPFAGTVRLQTLLDPAGGTWLVRRQLWEASVAMVRDHPLTGVGLDNFLYQYEAYRLPEAWREPDLSHPHQLFLHFWLALGLPGLLLLGMQLWLFSRLWWARWQEPLSPLACSLLLGYGAGFAATLAHGLIDNSFFLVDLAFIWTMTMALTAETRGRVDVAHTHT